MPDLPADKPALRLLVWERLRASGAARFPGVRGRIPNFVGAEAAADHLAARPEWAAASVLKVNPDSPQRPVRHRALRDGKVLYMPAPKLAEAAPFLELDPADLPDGALWHASSIKGAFELGRPVRLDQMRPVDLIVTGCVAVTPEGARLGKGGGYSDLEFAMLVERGLIAPDVPIWTTVHPSQILPDGGIPMTEHDISLDAFADPQGHRACARPFERPGGVLFSELSDAKLASIPVLAARRGGP